MKGFFYRVTENDTVSSVSSKFNVPQFSIVRLNNLTEELKDGDILYIEKCDGKSYTVKPCDTVRSLSRKFGLSENELKEKIGSDYVFYGMTINI
ncbi:MAG: LysM peptidoglycan-binding domain-containing protein [Clostridia bacterium]|nr:LysM peptidoglycan-binding domain-containing protein [Clostridia bacterium]